MERLNLNIPEDAKKVLKRLARSAKRREAEKEEFVRRLEATMTPALRRRHLEIAAALERLRG